MSRIITTNYPGGLTLTNTGDSPVTIVSGVTISNQNGNAVQSSVNYDWSISNAGALLANPSAGGEGNGISLTGLGTLTNEQTGLISGYAVGVYILGSGTVVNQGTITQTETAGVGFVYAAYGHVLTIEQAALSLGGGGITNASNGLIDGVNGAIGLGGGGNVFNAGSIEATGPDSFGVALTVGGNVTNASGGSIYGASFGVLSDGAAVVTNQASASISGGAGVLIVAGAGTLNNQGFIAGYRAVALFDGGLVSNGGSGELNASYYGVLVEGGAGTVTNAGSIVSSNSNGGGGVVLLAGGSVSNAMGGSIDSDFIAVRSGYLPVAGYAAPPVAPAVTLFNHGTIDASDNAGAGIGVWLRGPGTIVNYANGVIQGATNGTISGGPLNGFSAGPFGIVAYYSTTLINSGSIGGTDFSLDAANTAAAVGNLVEITPGATFSAEVMGANSATYASLGTLELMSGASVGTISGIGSKYVNFGNVGINSNALWTLTNANTLGAGTTLTNSGTLILSNAILNDLGTVTGSGTFVLDPSTMTAGALVGTGEIFIEAGSTLITLGTVAGGETIAFAGNNAVLDLTPSGFSGDILGFHIGTTIDLAGITDATSAGIVNGHTLQIQQASGPAILLALDPNQNYTGVSFAIGAGDAITDNLASTCFLAGTQIATPAGETPVERLDVGEAVMTLRGEARRIVWIGTGRVLATRGRRNAATPVIVRKGAIAENVPSSDLRVTKAHSLYMDGVLIPVEFLVNHRSIVWDDHAQEVTIYHIELETHDILIANGAPAESYRDDGNRWLFQNANSGWDQGVKPACAPVLTGGPVVDAVWQRLLDQAGPRYLPPLTADADVHLEVDGVRIDPAQRAGDVLVFQLAGMPDAARIVSRAAVPQELGLARDPRLLGVALKRVVVRQGTRFRTIGGDDDRLTVGFHAFEPDTKLRWTDGDAVLPASIFDDFVGPMEVVIHLGATSTYLDDGSIQRVA